MAIMAPVYRWLFNRTTISTASHKLSRLDGRIGPINFVLRKNNENVTYAYTTVA